MNGEENDQIDIPNKFTDDLPIPNEINLSYIDKNDAYELFKCSKYNDSSQPIFKYQPKNNTIFENLKNDVMDLD